MRINTTFNDLYSSDGVNPADPRPQAQERWQAVQDKWLGELTADEQKAINNAVRLGWPARAIIDLILEHRGLNPTPIMMKL